MNDHREDESERRGGCGVAALAAASLILLPVLYVLSIGPAVVLVEKNLISEESAEFFYTPLIWLHQATPIGPFLDWYVELWM